MAIASAHIHSKARCRAQPRLETGERNASVQVLQLGDAATYRKHAIFVATVRDYASQYRYRLRQLQVVRFRKLMKPACIAEAMRETSSRLLLFVDLDVS